LGVPVVPSDQPPPVVQPTVAPLHLPARLADLMSLGRPARFALAVGPYPLGHRRLNQPSPQPLPELRAVIALVGSQAGRSLLGASLGTGHSHPVPHFQSHGDLSHVGRCHQKGQRQAITFGHQMNRATFALMAIGDIFSPFLAGTKLPSRKAWLQSSLPCWSSVLRNANLMRSHTPSFCHSWSRRWQVERLPYFGGCH
jgi:hypothetical protein